MTPREAQKPTRDRRPPRTPRVHQRLGQPVQPLTNPPAREAAAVEAATPPPRPPTSHDDAGGAHAGAAKSPPRTARRRRPQTTANARHRLPQPAATAPHDPDPAPQPAALVARPAALSTELRGRRANCSPASSAPRRRGRAVHQQVACLLQHPRVVRVCGAGDVGVLGVDAVDYSLGLFDRVVMLGQNFGMLGARARARRLLGRFARVTTPRAVVSSRRRSTRTRSTICCNATTANANLRRGICQVSLGCGSATATSRHRGSTGSKFLRGASSLARWHRLVVGAHDRDGGLDERPT
jgi:hypothetical protein